MKIQKFKKIFAVLISSCTLFCICSGKAEENFPAPIPTTEFNQMDYAPLYLTYSWLPVPNTKFYLVQVIKIEETQEKIIRELMNTEAFDKVTDFEALTEVGKYYWHVKVIDKNKKTLSNWSEKYFFEVTSPVKFAVLGDSISHGGASYIPAGQLSCQWETYCDVPIKNLARSGDTTQMLIERFETDVIPFKPQTLIIMAGVNDVRLGLQAEIVIENLKTLRQKCFENNITPIFCTITSMNPEIITSVGIDLTSNDWRQERKKINSWIMQTQDFIDTAKELTDASDYLRAEMTPDGLHPNLRGKKIIGETIAAYLKKSFKFA